MDVCVQWTQIAALVTRYTKVNFCILFYFFYLNLIFLSSGRQLTILNKSLHAMHYRRYADMVYSTKVYLDHACIPTMSNSVRRHDISL